MSLFEIIMKWVFGCSIKETEEEKTPNLVTKNFVIDI